MIRRIKTHPNPELLCSKSIYNFFSPLPGGKSGFQVGKLWGEGMPPVQWPVASFLALARVGMHFWRQAASHPSGGVALSTLTLESPGCEDDGALQLEEIPKTRKTTPGISKWLDPSLVTKEEGGRGAYSSFKNLEATALLLRKGGKKQVFPTREKHNTKPTQRLITQLPDAYRGNVSSFWEGIRGLMGLGKSLNMRPPHLPLKRRHSHKQLSSSLKGEKF